MRAGSHCSTRCATPSLTSRRHALPHVNGLRVHLVLAIAARVGRTAPATVGRDAATVKSARACRGHPEHALTATVASVTRLRQACRRTTPGASRERSTAAGHAISQTLPVTLFTPLQQPLVPTLSASNTSCTSTRLNSSTAIGASRVIVSSCKAALQESRHCGKACRQPWREVSFMADCG